MQGLAVVPLFAGFDPETGRGRIFSYDVTGGRYEEHGFHAVGSGSLFARGSLKKLYRDDLSATGAVTAASRRCTTPPTTTPPPAGPTSPGGIFPVVAVVDVDGFRASARRRARRRWCDLVVDARAAPRPTGPKPPCRPA